MVVSRTETNKEQCAINVLNWFLVLRFRSLVKQLDLKNFSQELHRIPVLSDDDKKEICKGLIDHVDADVGTKEEEFTKLARYLNTKGILKKDSFSKEEWSRIVRVYRRATVLWYASSR